MNRNDLLSSIQSDLGANYQTTDSTLLGALLDETIDNALSVSNRNCLVKDETSKNTQISILGAEIRKAVKTLYLQRGTEDVTNQSINGISGTYSNAMDTMRRDIIFNGKRLMR